MNDSEDELNDTKEKPEIPEPIDYGGHKEEKPPDDNEGMEDEVRDETDEA